MRRPSFSSPLFAKTVGRRFIEFLLLLLSTPSISKSMPFAMNARVSVKPDFRADFLQIMKHNAKETLEKEPGAIKFTLGEDSHASNVFYFHTRYKSQADFEYHKTTSHFAEYKKLSAFDPYVAPAVVQFFLCRGPTEITGPPQQSVCRTIELCVYQEVKSEFLTLLNDQQKDPFYFDFVYGESTQDLCRFHLHEQYNQHQTPKDFWKDFAFFLKSKVTNQYCNILDDP